MIAGFVERRPDKNLFAPQVAARLIDDVTSRMADELCSPGPIRSVALVERKKEGDDRVYRYRLTYPHLTLFLVCAFDKDDKIAGFGTQD